MALKGQAKTDYQREYMRKRQGTKKPRAGLITRSNKPDIGSNKDESKQETLVELRKLISGDALKSKSSPLKEQSNSRIPLYNYTVHGPGDKVRMPDGQVVVIPDLDADGYPIEVGSAGRLVSDNLFKPSFNPYPKPEKKQKKGRRR